MSPWAPALQAGAPLCLDELVNRHRGRYDSEPSFRRGFRIRTVVILTSNSKPSDLYKGGLNRDQFLPFIDLVEHNVELLQLEAALDYRLQQLSHARSTSRPTMTQQEPRWTIFGES